MGCDIYMRAELYDAESDTWAIVPTGNLYPRREYAVFGILAGVRGVEFEPIAEPRGIPQVVSLEWAFEYKNRVKTGNHSFSWVTAQEVLDYYDGKESKKALAFLRMKVNALCELADADHVRLVFCFNS